MRGQYYCATLSELVLQVKKNRKSLIKRAAARLNMFYDCVLIDEFQDFREYDYKLIMALAKQLNDVVLVGDYHQHSVSATNNSGKPFKNKTVEVSYDDFVASIIKEGFTVDASTLALVGVRLMYVTMSVINWGLKLHQTENIRVL